MQRIWKALRYAIPLGTLAALAIAMFGAHWRASLPEHIAIAPPPAAALAPVDLPARGRALAGVVVAPGGVAVGDALVWLRAGDEPAWTYTDANGQFRFDAIARGPYQACIVARGFDPMRLTLPDSGAFQTIEMPPPLAPPPALPPIARSDLTGKVIAHDGRDLAGFAIVLTPTAPLETLSAPVPRTADVAREGTFTFDALIEGEYQVEVLPAWARGGRWPDLLRGLAEPARTFVHAAHSTALTLELESAEIAGRTVADDGEPLEGALVLVTAAADAGRVWPPISTAADGSFVARDLPPGAYTVTARAGAASVEETLFLVARERREMRLPALRSGP